MNEQTFKLVKADNEYFKFTEEARKHEKGSLEYYRARVRKNRRNKLYNQPVSNFL